QDAQIALERLTEIQSMADEEPTGMSFEKSLPPNRSISIRDLNFSYNDAGGMPVLKDINLLIPHGKVTAVVGASGSGKTTLLKLLLKFYEGYSGSIGIGGSNLCTDHTKGGELSLLQAEAPCNSERIGESTAANLRGMSH